MNESNISIFHIGAVILLLLFSLTGCSASSDSAVSTETQAGSTADSEAALTIVATLFPQYDFARELAGDKAEIQLLLPPGMESHSFEPTPGDIITIQNSDLFLYTGDEMEPWAANLAGDLPDSVRIVNLSEGISLEEEEDDHESETSAHQHSLNPHIWTSPVLAMKMVEHIASALIEADPANEDYYRNNADHYLEKLSGLDQTFRQIVSESNQKTLYIGSRFSLFYFVKEYGLSYVAAYDSCEEEAEPSIKRVLSMISSMRENQVSVVYYEELTEPYVANTIAEAAGAQPLLFHSCHNVSLSELEIGATYLSLMEQNAKNLKKGLE